MTERRRPIDLGLAGALADLLLAGILAAFLFVATDPTGDAVPRPIVLGVIYAVPGLIGLIGVGASRASVLVGAALPLLPGALLSFAGATLVFLIPAVLMLAGAATMRSRPADVNQLLLGAGRAAVICGLIVAAGWAAVIGLTEPGCVPIPGGQSCSSSLISVRGVIVASACLIAAVGVALGPAALPTLRRRRC